MTDADKTQVTDVAGDSDAVSTAPREALIPDSNAIRQHVLAQTNLSTGRTETSAHLPSVEFGKDPIEASRSSRQRVESQLLSDVRSELDNAARADRFSGVVLIAKDGRPLLTEARGLADREHGVPIDVDSKLRVASLGKMFTGVAVMKLVQDGKIRLDENLAQYMPEFPNKELASRVTIHDLLTHTGTFGDYVGPEFFSKIQDLKSIDDHIRMCGNGDSRGVFQPGVDPKPGQFNYSNLGYMLLGKVIERALERSNSSERTFYDYMQKNVLDVAAMKNTGYDPESVDVPGRAKAYTRVGDHWQMNTDKLAYRGGPANGPYSTVADLLRFSNALTSNKLLNPEYTKLLTEGKVTPVPGDPLTRYAYGFIDERTGGRRNFGHRGAAEGISSMFKIYPDSGYTVVVLSNFDPPSAHQMAQFIGDRLPR